MGITSKAEHRATSKTTLLVHHESFDRWTETQKLGELIVSSGHVYTAGCAEHQMCYFGLGLAPFLDGLGSCLFAQLRYLHHHHVLPSIQ
uniref:Uncharacterized protein n=1 Tax=Salix viminalis TaxID=40686 RepID=A0A6N2K5N5_SALVM